MKKRSCRRLFALLLVVALMLAACGKSGSSDTAPAETTQAAKEETTQAAKEETTQAPAAEETEAPAEEASGGVTFPLAEPVTFTIMVLNDGDPNANAEKIPILKELEEKTNVKINWLAIPSATAMNNLNSLSLAGEEGDAIMGMTTVIGESGTSSMGSNGLLIPLDEYIDNPELMPNLNSRVFAESPQTRAVITTADGHVYALPKYDVQKGNYLETPLWINTDWLEAVDEEIPTTVEDLHRVLTKFRDNDVNGNGNPNDEIPLMLSTSGSLNYPEGMLCMWGLATKDLPNDRYMDVNNGKVYYVGASEAYHDAIRTLSSWYKEGLIWSEIFTGNSETWTATTQNESAPLVGAATNKYLPSSVTFRDQYEVVPPISADGYQAKWWEHPGSLGAKGMFSITRSCEHPEILAAWIDQFYDLEVAMSAEYGGEGLGWEYNDEGKMVVLEADANKEEDQAILDSKMPHNIADNYPYAFTADDYSSRFILDADKESYDEHYDLYKDAMAKECWPRPYIADDIYTRINELYTDIDSTTDMYRANWLTGVSDIDAEWDGYLETLNKMGLEEFVDLHQQAYDVYLTGLNK